MSAHDHAEYVPGCFRCELGRDEAADAERDEQADIFAAIDARRCDRDFMDRLARIVKEERELLAALADATPEAPVARYEGSE